MAQTENHECLEGRDLQIGGYDLFQSAILRVTWEPKENHESPSEQRVTWSRFKQGTSQI
jgi:hypothetical protein